MPEFTPVQVVDRSKEKEWPHKLGVMDWDDTKIVFTKRQLIDFLKYTGVTVDTNFTQIAKLPRYAEFGTISGESSSSGAVVTETSAPSAPAAESASVNQGDPNWKPTRRVRTVPGGAQTFHLGEDDEYSWSPAPAQAAAPVPAAAPAPAPAAPANAPEAPHVVDSDGNAFKPTRRVRTAPGGKDSMGMLLSGE